MSSVPFFVDYLTIRQSYPEGGLPVINGGRVIRIDSDGEIEYVLDARHGLLGSFDSRVDIRCDGHTVEFSGNISRYGRADNLFGYSFEETIQKINQLIVSFGLPAFSSGRLYDFFDGQSVYSGARVSRIDITCNYATGSMLDSEALLRNMAGHHVGRQKGSLSVNGTTVEYGRGSKYVYGKLYCKTTELIRHKSKKSGQHVSDDVIAYCHTSGIVREEFTLKSRFLTQNGLAYLGAITTQKLSGVYMERSQLQRLEQVQYENFNDLPPRLRATYVSWKHGFPIDLPVSTFYRHRKQLLAYGIDISVPNNIHTLPIKVKTVHLSAVFAPDWYQRKYA